MLRRLMPWAIVVSLALVAAVGYRAARLPYLPVIHGSTDEEIARLSTWLEIGPGMRVADVGAGEGTFAVALARRVGQSGHVFATEVQGRHLAAIRRSAAEAGLSNISVIAGAATGTNLPEACCDAVFSRIVYHHLADHAAINADLFRAVRPGGRLLMIDFEPGGILNWFEHAGGADRGHGTLKETLIREVSAAGFALVRGPEPWRGRMYAALFRRP